MEIILFCYLGSVVLSILGLSLCCVVKRPGNKLGISFAALAVDAGLILLLSAVPVFNVFLFNRALHAFFRKLHRYGYLPKRST